MVYSAQQNSLVGYRRSVAEADFVQLFTCPAMTTPVQMSSNGRLLPCNDICVGLHFTVGTGGSVVRSENTLSSRCDDAVKGAGSIGNRPTRSFAAQAS